MSLQRSPRGTRTTKKVSLKPAHMTKYQVKERSSNNHFCLAVGHEQAQRNNLISWTMTRWFKRRAYVLLFWNISKSPRSSSTLVGSLEHKANQIFKKERKMEVLKEPVLGWERGVAEVLSDETIFRRSHLFIDFGSVRYPESFSRRRFPQFPGRGQHFQSVLHFYPPPLRRSRRRSQLFVSQISVRPRTTKHRSPNNCAWATVLSLITLLISQSPSPAAGLIVMIEISLSNTQRELQISFNSLNSF